MKTATRLEFAEEPFTADFVDEVSSLTIRHWVEVGRMDVKFQPDWHLYTSGSDLGFLKLFTARRDGVLKGYAVFVLRNHPHYSGTTIACQDVLYLDKAERKGMAGARFIKFCEQQLSTMDVAIVQQSTTVNHDFGSVLERLGYTPTSIIYERRI